MLCPNCRAVYAVEDTYCRHCGADLTVPSTNLVPTSQANLPSVLHNPQLPRLAAGVGALAFGVGLELLRRSLITRLSRPARQATKLVPTPSLGTLREALMPQQAKATKLPRGYEVHETIIYMSRVIRRED